MSAAAERGKEAAVPLEEWYEVGRQLFEELAPAEVKARYEFPEREQWETFARRLQQALEGDSLEALAEYGPEARDAMRALRTLGLDAEFADWLEQRIDEIECAEQMITAPKPAPRPPTRPGEVRPPGPVQPVPYYELWTARVRNRPLPPRAVMLVPKLQSIFESEGLPRELVWLAEAESSFNPSARSPVGARGLFQFMPETARAMGLDTSWPDERNDPEKSARAAARYLRMLHGRFGNWALALAAYNAGQTRVARTLAEHRASTYTAIAGALPAETRMYVPKVCALIELRTGVTPERISPPQPRPAGGAPIR
jgi:membrane-bound lytic murein transglycosylase D